MATETQEKCYLPAPELCELNGGILFQDETLARRKVEAQIRQAIAEGRWDVRNGRVSGGPLPELQGEVPLFTCNLAIVKQKKECASRGGTLKRVGIGRNWHCILPAKDGGKACTKKSDCEIACLYNGTSAKRNEKVVGQCAIDNNTFGCKLFVDNGYIVDQECVD